MSKKKKEPKLTYADKAEVIDAELAKRSHKWFLNSVAWMDYDDVKQIIRAHIHKKWDQWDQSRALEPWLNKIISNQLKNILRNNYGNYVRPCLNCPFNQRGPPTEDKDGLCGFTASGLQCNECPLYAKWEVTKKSAYMTKMAVTIEHHSQEAFSLPETSYPCLEDAIGRVHGRMKDMLNEKKYKAYKMLYIDNLSDREVAEAMGYKTSETGRTAGYKQIRNLKKFFKTTVEELLQKEDIIISSNGKRTY